MNRICHLQKKHTTANKHIYMTSIDLEEAFDQVPRDVIYKHVRSRVIVARSLILEWMFIRALPEFEFGFDVYQGSVLASLYHCVRVIENPGLKTKMGNK